MVCAERLYCLQPVSFATSMSFTRRCVVIYTGFRHALNADFLLMTMCTEWHRASLMTEVRSKDSPMCNRLVIMALLCFASAPRGNPLISMKRAM